MNNSGIVHLKDEKFDTSQSREMQLLIKITHTRISYALVNGRDRRLLVLYDQPLKTTIEESINELLVKNDYLRSTFAGIKVSVQTSNFTFIPTPYYTRDNLDGYEKLVQANEGTKTFISSVNEDNIKCVVAFELSLIAPLISTFSEARFLCQANPLIEASLKTQESTAQKLILQFNEETFEACFIADNKLVLYNLYTINNADDFNYYLLMIMQQLAIEPNNTSVILAGNIVSDDEYFKRIEKYFKTIQFSNIDEIVNSSPAFDQLSKHRYYSLVSLALCE